MINKIHTTTPRTPSTYNHDTNINVWLNQVDDYLDMNKIKADKQKQETLLLRLDRTNRLALQKLIDNKTIKSYQDLQEHVKSLYNHDMLTTRDHVINFIQRQQQPNETIGEFYASIVELAKKAYPKLGQKDLDQQISDNFINGLNNSLIRQQLLINHDKQSNADILTKAIRLHTDLGDSIHDYNNNQHINVNHVNTSTQRRTPLHTQRQFQHSTQLRNHDREQTNNNQQYPIRSTFQQRSPPSNYNDIKCYRCNQNGHTSRFCTSQQNNTHNHPTHNNHQRPTDQTPSQILSTQTGNQQH